MSEPILVRAELSRAAGLPRQRIEARIDASALDGETAHRYELWVARRCFDLLRRHYPGHLWCVDCSLLRGGVAVSIPILLGGNWVYFIRMTDLTPAAVVRAGGEILERYRLPRGRFELGSFLEARKRHSILADPRQKVPS